MCWHNPLNFSAILVLLHLTSGYSETQFYFEIHSEIAEIHVSGLLTDRINNKLEKGNLINEHALNREPVPLSSLMSRYFGPFILKITLASLASGNNT